MRSSNWRIASRSGAERSPGSPPRGPHGACAQSPQRTHPRTVPGSALLLLLQGPGTADPVLPSVSLGHSPDLWLAMPAPAFHGPSGFAIQGKFGGNWWPRVPAEGEGSHVPPGKAGRLVQLLSHARYPPSSLGMMAQDLMHTKPLQPRKGSLGGNSNHILYYHVILD